MNIKVILSYDGTSYFGWQKTKTGPSVQETLEQALFTILQKPVSLEAASRTDRGVHARGQVAHFFLDEKRDLDRLRHSLNSVLPSDVRALQIEQAKDSFHPTLDAAGKEYRYQICLGSVQNPMHRLYSWAIHQPLHLEQMRKAAAYLAGTHDFASFTTQKLEKTQRTLFDVQLSTLPEERLEIRLLGDRFLYKMARRIVGTLVAIGKGALPSGIISTLLTHPNRSMAGMTAPAHGLFLHQVFYTQVDAKTVEWPVKKGLHELKK